MATSGVPQARCEALVVGAGPAGLFAALPLASAGVSTVVVDAGPDIDDRLRRDLDGRGDYESGVGGAGLFSDGKLCMSLDVGGHLEHTLSPSERQALLGEIESVFVRLFLRAGVSPVPSTRPASDLYEAAASVGLGFKYYPVLQIGTDQCADVVRALRVEVVEAGASIVSDTKLVGLRVEGDKKIAEFERRDGERFEMHAANVVLALGKVGAAHEAALCRSAGVETQTQAMYIGLRYEAPSDVLGPLFGTSKDPKYSLRFADGSKIKTHCASRGGQVLRLEYEGLPLAGGHNYSTGQSDVSGFSVLWDGLAPENSLAAAQQVMKAVMRRTGGTLAVESGSSVLRLGGPIPSAFDARTCRESEPGQMREFLPREYFSRLEEFMSRLDALAPGTSREGWFYAPAIEWWMERVSVNGSMETSQRGLFACGDGSGWSQGIVHAAATGVLAASAICARERGLRAAA